MLPASTTADACRPGRLARRSRFDPMLTFIRCGRLAGGARAWLPKCGTAERLGRPW
jgi:hypothetical protein